MIQDTFITQIKSYTIKNLKFKIYGLTTVLSCFCFLGLHSQEKDSIANTLRLQIEEATSDSLRINLKLDLSGRVALFNIDEAIAIVKDVEEDIRKILDF